MANNKTYDWFAASLYQPQFTPDDLVSLGVTAENSSMLDRETYKNNEDVKEQFSKNGSFDEAAFNNFYDACLTSYNTKAQDDFEQKVIDNMAYDPYNWLAPTTSKVADIRARAELGKTNKLHKEDSVESFGISSAPLLSDREIGQMNFVRDKDGNVLDFTPNDRGFFKSIFDPTYVLAQYDEDTVDEFGIQHYKGELKRDEDGATYYEELGDRALGNKIVLRPLDVLTEDLSPLNRYDFFDQDSLETEGWKAFAHNAVKIAPMIIPGGIGAAYATGTALLNMAKVMPELGKALDGIMGLGKDHETPFLDKMEGVAAKFGASKSDASMESTWTWENAFDFIGSTAVQLFQQQSLAKGSEKLIEALGSKNYDLARALSSGYMAATSCEGVYESFKDAGASDFVAGVGALANIYVLNKALNQDYFKRWWAKGDRWLDPMAKDYKRVAMGVANKYMAASATEAGQQTMTKQATKGLFNKLTNLFSESILPYTGEKLGYVAGDYFKGAINEGLEEVMEEGFVDTSKAIAKVFDALGIRMTTDPDASLDFGFTVEEAGQRYLQAFVGGFGGGAIFHGINRIQKGKDLKVDLKKMDENSLRELSYIIAQGRGQEIKDYYKKLHKKGLLGSTTLSGTKFETITNADGTTEEKAQTAVQGESQNDIVYEALIQHIDYIEGMMEDEGIKVSEKYLMNQVQDTIASMMSDSFFGEEGTTNESYGNRLKQAAYLSWRAADGGMLNEFNTIGARVMRAKNEYDQAVEKVSKSIVGDTAEDKEKRKKAIKDSKEVQRAEERYKEARQQLDDFKSGKHLHEYVGRGQFMMAKQVADHFEKINDINTYASIIKGTSYERLTDEEKADMQFEYKQYMEKEGGKANLWRAYDVYQALSTKYKSQLEKLDKAAKNGKLDERRSTLTLYKRLLQLASEDLKLDEILNSKESSEELKAEAEKRKQELALEQATLKEQAVSLIGIRGNVIDPRHKEEADALQAREILIKQQLQADPENEDLLNALASVQAQLQELTLPAIDPDLLTFGHMLIDSESAYSKMNNTQDKQAAIDEMSKYLLALYSKFVDEGVVMQDDQEFDDFLRYLKPNTNINNLTDNFGFQISDFYNILSEKLSPLVDKYNEAIKVKDFAPAQKIYDEINQLLDNLDVDNEQGYIAVSEEDDALLVSLMETLDIDIRPLPGIYNIYKMTAEQEQAIGKRGSKIMTPYVKSKILNAVLPVINGKPSIEFITEIQKLKSKLTYTPTREILAGFYRDINGVDSSLIDTIDAELKGFASYKTLEDYLLKSKGSEAQLKAVDEVIDVVTGLLEGAGSGLNASINLVAKNNNLLVIDANTQEMVKKDLNEWKGRVDDLLTLAEVNSANKLNEQRDIAVHCLPLYGKRLLSDEFNKTWVEKTGLPSLQDIWVKITNNKWKNVEITAANFSQYEKDWMEFESAVYKAAQELSADKFNNLAPALVECFAGNDRLWMGESTELSTKTEVIEDIDLLHYLADIIVADAKVIRGALKDVLEKDDKNFAPLLSQELAIRSNISWVANRNFYDKILTAIANKRPDTEKHKPVYRAVHAMFGGAGVGKTKVIARTTKKILEKLGANVEYVYVAKTIEQAKNLQKSCGGDGSVYDADQFSTALFEEWPTTEPVDIGGIKGTGHAMYNGAAVFINRKSMKNLGKYDHDAQFTDSIYKKNDNKSIASVFKTSTAKIKVVVVDEATQFTTAQWDCMSMRACHPNEQFSIFALGDLRQQCGIVSYDHRIDNNGLIVNSSAKATSTLEEGLLLKSPRISVTMRADVMALYKASQGYNKAFDACEEWQKKNKEVGIFGKVNLDASVIRDYTKNITHSYWHNDDFSEFYGIHSCDSDKATKILTGLLSKNKPGSICYIGDGTNSLNYPAGIQNLNPNNAQGSEFDYVVIDMKWLNGGTVDDKFEVPVNMLRSLYTLIQRARKGCIIVNNNENGDVAEYFNISQIFDPSGADGFKLSDTQHKSYKEWRMKSYEDIKYDAEAFRKMFKDFSITTGAKTGGGTTGKSGGSTGQQQAPGAPTGTKPGNAGVGQLGGKGTVGSRGFASNEKLTEATKTAEKQYAERKKGEQVAAESLRKTKTAEISSPSKEQHRHGGNQAMFREWWESKNGKSRYTEQLPLQGSDTTCQENTLKFLSDFIKISYSTYLENREGINENQFLKDYGLIIPMAYTKEGIQRKTSLKLDGGDDTEIVGGYADGLTAAQITNLNSIDPSQVQIPAGIAGIAPQIWYTELDDSTPIPYKKVGDKSIPPRLVVAKFVDAQQNTILTVPLDIVYTTRKGLYKGRILRSAKLGFINDDENRGKLSVDTLLDTYGLYSFGTKVYTGGISDEFGSFSKEKSNQHASFLGVTDNFAVSMLAKASGEGYWAKTKHKDQTWVHDWVSDSTMVGVELSAKPSDVIKYCCALNRLRDEMRKCNSMINGEFIIPDVEFQSATGRLNTLRTAAIEAGKVIYGDEFTLPELKTERSELAKQADAIDNGGYDMRQYRCLTDHEATYQPVNQAERFAGKYAAMTMESPDWAKAFDFVISSLWSDNVYGLSSRTRRQVKTGSIKLNFTIQEGKEFVSYTIVPDPKDPTNILCYKTDDLVKNDVNATVIKSAKHTGKTTFDEKQDSIPPFTKMLKEITGNDKGKVMGMNISYELNGDNSKTIVLNDGSLISELFFWIENNHFDNGNGTSISLYDDAMKGDIYASLDCNMLEDGAYKLGVFVNNVTDNSTTEMSPLIYEDNSRLILDRPTWRYTDYTYNHGNWFAPDETLNVATKEEKAETEAEKTNKKEAKEWLDKFNNAVCSSMEQKNKVIYNVLYKTTTEENETLRNNFINSYSTANDSQKIELKEQYVETLNAELAKHADNGLFYKIVVDAKGVPSINLTAVISDYFEGWANQQGGTDIQEIPLSFDGGVQSTKAVKYQVFSVNLDNNTKKFLVTLRGNSGQPGMMEINDEFIDSITTIQQALTNNDIDPNTKNHIQTYVINSLLNASEFDSFINPGTLTAIFNLFSNTAVLNEGTEQLRNAVLDYLKMRLKNDMC